MPYPALPPELSQVLISPAYKAASCSQAPEDVAPALAKAVNPSQPARPSSPSRFAPESTSRAAESPSLSSDAKTLSAQEQVQHSEQSCAALLENTIPKGYPTAIEDAAGSASFASNDAFVGTKAISKNSASFASNDAFVGTKATSNDREEARSQPVALSKLPPFPAPVVPAAKLATPSSPEIFAPTSAVPSSPQIFAPISATPFKPQTTTAPTSYSLSGVRNRLTNHSDSAIVTALNQAALLEVWTDSYNALNSLTADDLKRFAQQKSQRTAQIPNSTPGVDGSFSPSSPFPGQPVVPPAQPTVPLPPALSPPGSQEETPGAQPAPPKAATPVPVSPANVIEVTADQQEYDQQRQFFTAEGKVMMRFRGGLLEADRVQVNLTNRLTVAEGDVALTRGNQVLRGQRFEYNFVQGAGTITAARGEIFLPSTSTDTAIPAATDATSGSILARPISDRITANQPLQNVTSSGGFSVSAGAGRDVGRVPGALPRGGEVKRLRFEAEQLEFTPDGWVATNIQITNDPFSPPELVLKADRATLTRISPFQQELVATHPRLVFDQHFSLPFFPSRTVLDSRPQQAGLVNFGFDSQDRGGLFAERAFDLVRSPSFSLRITPQIYLQRMIVDTKSVTNLDNFGFKLKAKLTVTPTTDVVGSAVLTTLDPEKYVDNLRASLRLNQKINISPLGVHTLAFEYSYRDRLFNGSLGFQTVQSSVGFVFLSPDILLGKSGLVLNYQAGYQGINADTDRANLLKPIRDNNRVTLGRFQASVGIGRGFTLWQGKPLPATRDEGLNYTPVPVTPYISVNAGLRGVFSDYTNGDIQNNLIGSVGVYGQFGHFSRRFFDYTAVGISYTQAVGNSSSPFLFDRSVDDRVLSLSLFQQLYGPLRAGIQTSYNLRTSEAISTDYFLEYSRRTYGVIVRYNPVLSIGSISLRISDFNWSGGTDVFEGSDITPVEGGLNRTRF